MQEQQATAAAAVQAVVDAGGDLGALVQGPSSISDTLVLVLHRLTAQEVSLCHTQLLINELDQALQDNTTPLADTVQRIIQRFNTQVLTD